MFDVRYIGSKSATLPWLSQVVAERAPGASSLLDPFAGACTVARHFKQFGFEVTTGDVLRLSQVFQLATVALDKPPQFGALLGALGLSVRAEEDGANQILAYLDALPGDREGFISRTYSPSGPARRQFYTSGNAARIDAIRRSISCWRSDGLLDVTEHAYLLTALLEAADRVANTAGTYYAYLKSWTRKARQPLQLTAPRIALGPRRATHHRGDARDVARAVEADVLYLDPPYNERNYERYYHLPETLARETQPEVAGRSGVPVAVGPRSDFCRPSQARNALAELCAGATARHILVHYAADGLVTHDEIMAILQSRGPVRCDEIAVRGYAARAAAGGSVQHRIYWCDVREGA